MESVRQSRVLILTTIYFAQGFAHYFGTAVQKIRGGVSAPSRRTTLLPARLLKDGSDAIARPLIVLMNRSIAEDSIPSDWKHAVVTPVYKSDSKTDPTNYRPIYLLPVFSKILERAVHKMVYTYLQQYNRLSIYQSGFRSNEHPASEH